MCVTELHLLKPLGIVGNQRYAVTIKSCDWFWRIDSKPRRLLSEISKMLANQKLNLSSNVQKVDRIRVAAIPVIYDYYHYNESFRSNISHVDETNYEYLHWYFNMHSLRDRTCTPCRRKGEAIADAHLTNVHSSTSSAPNAVHPALTWKGIPTC